MASEYFQDLQDSYSNTTEKLLSALPPFMTEFSEYLSDKVVVSSMNGYIRDVSVFLIYLSSLFPELKNKPILSFPEHVLNSVTLSDIKNYQDLLTVKKYSPAYIKKQLSALSIFFKFLLLSNKITGNPMSEFKIPFSPPKEPFRLSEEQLQDLISGIAADNKFLIKYGDAEYVADIIERAWVRRERTVLRNIAIIYLIFDTGLKISEIISLNIKDVKENFSSVSISDIEGNTKEVVLSGKASTALKNYICGIKMPEELNAKFSPVSGEVEFAKSNINNQNIKKAILKNYPGISSEGINDLIKLVDHFRRQGRESFKPSYTCEALFISSRCSRLTVRMVEIMVNEMIRTYVLN